MNVIISAYLNSGIHQLSLNSFFRTFGRYIFLNSVLFSLNLLFSNNYFDVNKSMPFAGRWRQPISSRHARRPKAMWLSASVMAAVWDFHYLFSWPITSGESFQSLSLQPINGNIYLRKVVRVSVVLFQYLFVVLFVAAFVVLLISRIKRFNVFFSSIGGM